MMYDFEYDNIINHWADKFDMEVDEIQRNILIESYKVITEQFGVTTMSFEELIQNTLLDLKWETKYPGLNLHDRVFAYYNMN